MILRFHVAKGGLLHIDRLYEAPCSLGSERFYRYYNSASKKFTSLFDVSAEESRPRHLVFKCEHGVPTLSR